MTNRNLKQWKLGETYTVNELVQDEQSVLYQCLQSHTTLSPDWNPANCPALFACIGNKRTDPQPQPAADERNMPTQGATKRQQVPLDSQKAPVPTTPSGSTFGTKRLLVGYYQSWSAPWARAGSLHELASLGSLYNVVCISFAQPDATYQAGSFTFAGTGLQFNSDFAVVRDAIQLLRNSRQVSVLLSVGGATYHNWSQLNVTALKALVDDLGVDGIDIDCEDFRYKDQLGSIISNLRSMLPRSDYLVTMAVFSVGAYGQGAFVYAQPQSESTGMCVPALQQSGHALDAVLGMFYDASDAFSPQMAFDAYRSLFAGPIAMGVEVPPEAWGGHVLTLSEVKEMVRHVVQRDPHGASGIMIWSHHKEGHPSASEILSVITGT